MVGGLHAGADVLPLFGSAASFLKRVPIEPQRVPLEQMGRSRGTGFVALALCASGAAFDVAGLGSGARGQLAFAGLAGPPRGAGPARSQARGGRSSQARAGAGARATSGGCLAGAGAAALLGLRRDLRCRVPRFAVKGKKGDKRLSQMDLLRNSFLLTLAELPGPWEVWREERRAAMIRGLDLYEAGSHGAPRPPDRLGPRLCVRSGLCMRSRGSGSVGVPVWPRPLRRQRFDPDPRRRRRRRRRR